MKEEQRIIFVADDGTPFLHRYECRGYEKKLESKIKEPKTYTKLFHNQQELIEFANNFNSDKIIWDKKYPPIIRFCIED